MGSVLLGATLPVRLAVYLHDLSPAAASTAAAAARAALEAALLPKPGTMLEVPKAAAATACCC